jgi:hypothetical protein
MLNIDMKIHEVLGCESCNSLSPIKPKKPSPRTISTIKTIKSKPPLTLKQLRTQSRKDSVERAKEAAQHGREIDKWNQK